MTKKILKFSHQYNGFLFIGDPHVTKRIPGKRLESSFLPIILDKISQAVETAIKENLYIVILGDLFDDSSEKDYEMVTKLIRILKKLPNPPITAEGNHEKTKTTLTDDDALTLMMESDKIYTIEDNDIMAQFKIGDKYYYIGGTPYGSKIPSEVILDPKLPLGDIIWLSHENLDFGNSYPGVIPLQEIKGVSMLVNGHIHQEKKSIQVGNMLAHNPGNITRLSIDCKDHDPSVWKWTPDLQWNLQKIPLRYEKNVFNLVGYQVNVAPQKIIVQEEINNQQVSQFVNKMHELQQEIQNEPSKTNDGAHMIETIKVFGKAMNIDENFTNEIVEIVKEAAKTSIDND